MIELTKLNNEKYYMNPNQVEIIELTPDTLITMTDGRKYYALESAATVVERIEAYYRRTSVVVRSFKEETVDF